MLIGVYGETHMSFYSVCTTTTTTTTLRPGIFRAWVCVCPLLFLPSLLGGWFLWVCFSWSLEAPLLSGGCDGLAEPSLFSLIPCGAPNSMRVSSAIPTNVGLTITSRVSSMKTLLLVPRVLNGPLRSSILLSSLSEVHPIASAQLPSAPPVFGVLDPVFGLLVPAFGLWFTQAFCLMRCPSRFQLYACDATCVYAHGSLIPDDSALAWFVACASSQVQSGLGYLADVP